MRPSSQPRGRLPSARAAAAAAAPHLSIQIDLWLTELYIERGEQAAAQEALKSAESHLINSNRRGLYEWLMRLRRCLTSRRSPTEDNRTPLPGRC
jgi:hypothetical protein